MYELYPFPRGFERCGPDFVFTYAMRMHFLPSDLAGRNVLDAGCGTGHKLAALALSYPAARFVGIDLSEQSLAVARSLVSEIRLANVELRRENLLEMDLEDTFDLVQSIGVLHHLEDPLKGLRNLGRALKESGLLSLWFYHPFGEADRLIKRELLLTLWQHNWEDMAQGQALMEALDLNLPPTYYGPREIAGSLESNADAYMHPIVNAYRFDEIFAMLREAGNDWAAVDFVNLEGDVKFLNLDGVTDPLTSAFCLRDSDLFPSELVRERFGRLSKMDRLRAVELASKPRGYQLFAGKADSHVQLGERIRGNVVQLR
ncbi:MAG: class I SAM-dependent methyltransferase [Desulfobacteraceae bacterium]|nr:class I SAM-dependent methyltransferase [Desulfobacteraceae bacterium]